MLWFPVQGWAALAMPFCQHEANSVEMAEKHAPPVVEAGEHCMHHSEQDPSTGKQTSAKAQCDHCTACHLAQVPMLVLPPVSLSGQVPAQRIETAAVFYYQLFPEQPQRPPLNLA